VLAIKTAKIVKAAKAVEKVAAARHIRNAALIARGNRLHTIGEKLTRWTEKFGTQVNRQLPNSRLRPDWRFGSTMMEMKRGSAAGIRAGTEKLARYRDAYGSPGRNLLLTYPEKPGQWWKWRLRIVD
jgi:hypothetical protein